MNWTEDIQVFNYDCMEAMSEMEDNQFDLAIVDVPYGIGESMNDNESRGKLANAKDYGRSDWDSEPPPNEYFYELNRVSKNQIIWGANHFISRIMYHDSSCWIVWDKNNHGNDFADCELAYTSFATAVRKFKFTWNGMLQGDMKNKETRIHRTQKPVKLYSWLLDNYAKEGDTILDTHVGSCSLAIACHNRGFKLTAYEIDKDYYDEAHKRFKLITAQKQLF